MTSYEFGMASHQGVRGTNQDCIGTFEPSKGFILKRRDLPLFVVADGMGGHQGGEIASQIAVQAAGETFKSEKKLPPGERLKRAINVANISIIRQSDLLVGLEKMGTTIVAGTLTKEQFFVANIGDSRAYRIRDEIIEQITLDHSMIEEQFRAGLITRAQAQNAPMRNIITRSLGKDRELEIDLFEVAWVKDDVFVFCSDGLWGAITDEQLSTVAAELPPQEAADKLVQIAMTGQSSDNISVIVVKVNW